MKKPSPNAPNQRLTEDDRQRAMRLLMSGLSTAVVAKRFGVTPKTIRQFWNEKLRPNPPKDEGETLMLNKSGERLERSHRQDVLDSKGWYAIACATARFLCLADRSHGIQPIERINRKTILLHCGCLREAPRTVFSYGRGGYLPEGESKSERIQVDE